ncbi:hypothetical protein BX616_004012 [Lobosporangium transversale]|nr:hypothetical protein BX616_004012 [Lobosporangium transversale]
MATDIHVLIVGAGVGGLALALMLERASISYELLEKSTEVRQLGTAITLSCIMQIFEQLDMYEELFSLSRPFGALHVRDEDLSYKGTFWSRPPGDDIEGLYGDYPRVIGRPDLIKLLMSRIPANRIHFGKRVLSTTQDEHQVIVKCADETTFTGSVLVGADGAYSSVRQNMYRELEKTGLLPKTDASPMGCSFECVVGISNPVSPDDYPVLKQDFSEFEIILGKEAPYGTYQCKITELGFLSLMMCVVKVHMNRGPKGVLNGDMMLLTMYLMMYAASAALTEREAKLIYLIIYVIRSSSTLGTLAEQSYLEMLATRYIQIMCSKSIKLSVADNASN